MILKILIIIQKIMSIFFLNYSFSIFNDQIPLINAFKDGLSCVIPIELSSLFLPSEFEMLFTGPHHISVELLKEITKYESGLSINDQRIKYLWEVLESFSEVELKKYLMFTTSCSRIPIYNKNFYIKISPLNNNISNPDNLLPISHTCFYTLNLPNYSTSEILKEKLIWAISHCDTLDLDFLNH